MSHQLWQSARTIDNARPHAHAIGRAIQIYEHDEIDQDALLGILSEIVEHNRRGGWRRLSRQ
ncbi:hypothetical protein [Nocardioides sp.]|uniref:hypothetical protein n=1 Tax=Nocardioides sp. TaxID=35761 RepID=UPI002D12AE26|nr:hypothetical protein [Nocardioides sp.]HXH80985.1 hypothetical protein [Nocardioides sp.]